MWNKSFYLFCLIHLRRRWRLKRRETEFWELPIATARTLEGAYYTLYGAWGSVVVKALRY